MSDEAAIRLFVADGGLAHEWHAQDEVTRMFYRRAATPVSAKDTAEDTLKRYPRIMSALATQENSRETHEPRPMTGFLSSMSAEGKRKALEYTGPDGPIGDPEFLSSRKRKRRSMPQPTTEPDVMPVEVQEEPRYRQA